MASASAKPPLVLVTGVSGFLGSVLLKELLVGGQYRVRGTIRDASNEKKAKPIREICPDAKYPVELVSADLTKDEGWQSAVEGCTYVLHTASPVPVHSSVQLTVANLVDAPVQGMKRVMDACAQSAGTVKRVVATSSFYACYDKSKEGDTLTEDDWPDKVMSKHLYVHGKYLAERVAWEFVESLPDEKKFELVTIHPSVIIGPNVLKRANSTNVAILELLQRELPCVFKATVPWVDVRDVARAHIMALTNEKAPGNRYMVSAGEYANEEMARILREEFGPQGYDVPRRTGPNLLVKLGALFDKSYALARDSFLRPVKGFDSTKFKTHFNFQFRDFRDTVIDTTHTMIELGTAVRKPGYRGRGGTASESSTANKDTGTSSENAKPTATSEEAQVKPESGPQDTGEKSTKLKEVN